MIDYSGKIPVERVSGENENCFFGYYDLSPENEDGTKVLVQRAPFNDHMPEKADVLEVGYIDMITRKFVLCEKTTAWNFQEGCRAQWLNNEQFIFNYRTMEGFGSAVYDTEKNEIIRRYSMPVYSIDRNNKRAITVNFCRNRYCYAHEKTDEQMTSDEGVHMIDLKTGDTRQVVSLKNIMKRFGTDEYKNWIEHAVWNPTGDAYYFYHRWSKYGDDMQTRICVSDLEGNVSSLIESENCSHAGWKNDHILTAWVRLPSRINQLQKNEALRKTKLYRKAINLYHRVVKNEAIRQKMTNDSYVNFNILDGSHEKLDESVFTIDGHCTWSQDGRWMITDTYPDKDNFRSLYLYDGQEKEVHFLGRFFSYPDYRDTEHYKIAGIRCDLHPKWSFREKYVYFDSTHEGYRGLYRIDISRIKGAE